MTIELHRTKPNLLYVSLSGKLAKEDYENFVPAVDQAVADAGRVRMLVEMRDFHGWKLSAAWEDTKFGLHHFRDIERLAIVGESAWQHGMAAFCKPFTMATVRYFDVGEADRAKEWIEEE